MNTSSGREPDGTSTRYAYDPAGNLDMVTSLDGAGHSQMRTFHYDGRGFLTREVQPELTGATTYLHDALGNVIKKTTPTGTLFSSYDEAGRLLSVSSPQAMLKQFTYGSAGVATGKLIEAQAFNWRTVGSTCTQFEVRQAFTFDAVTGRVAAADTTLWQGGALEHWTQGYAYDGAGRVTTVSYPNCVAVCSSTPRQVTTAYTLGRPTSVSGFANPITYHDNGTLATIQHANGALFTETADPSGMPRPGALQANWTPQSWPLEAYSYDGAGNVKAIGGKSFAYDVQSRIVAATVPTDLALPYQAYEYDGFDNLTKIYHGTSPADATWIAYSADMATNRLTGANYDDSGELTSVPGTTFNWTWDVLGQATSVTTDTESWIHTYDAAGERVWSWRTSPSRLDTYALRGQDKKVLSLFTKTGSAYTWEDYAYREAMVLGAAFSDGTTYHFDLDHLGSVRLETPGILSQPTYYRDLWPYGDEATPPASPERMRFAGQERDLGSLTSIADDIDYMHARYYRPLFARFLSPDPAAGARQPHGWNRYSYAAGNPLRLTDPTGRYLCADKAACAKFEDARLANLADAATQASATALGPPGIDNGVTVKFGDTGSADPAMTEGNIEANPQGTAMVAKTTVTVKPDVKGVDLEALVAHEGIHVSQWQAWAASWDMSKSTPYDVSKNPRLFDAERDAYLVENAVYTRHQISGKIFDCKGCVLGIANKTIGDIDKAIRLILRDPNGPYHLTPTSPQRLDPRWQ